MLIEHVAQISTFIIEAFLHMWPYLLLSIPLAVAVRVSDASKHIRKAFVGHPIKAIILATIVGAFSPFCSCGVIPIIASLLIAGVPLGPVMSFWIASPTMDPEIFFLSVGLLGTQLAVARVVATLILSVTAGYITHRLDQRQFFKAGILREQERKTDWSLKRVFQPVVALFSTPSIEVTTNSPTPVIALSSIQVVAPVSQPTESSCSTGTCSISKPQTLWQKIQFETIAATWLIVKFMFIAFLLEALIVLYVPQETIISVLGANNPLAIALAGLTGIPLYTTNLTALPLMSGLLEQGMLPGAALAFLIAGPVTTIPAMSAVFGIAKPRVFAVYFAAGLLGAVVLGYGYQVLVI